MLIFMKINIFSQNVFDVLEDWIQPVLVAPQADLHEENEQESENERKNGAEAGGVVELVGESGTGEEGVDEKEVGSSVADGEDDESDNFKDDANDEEDGEGGKNAEGEDGDNRGGIIFFGQSANEFHTQEDKDVELSYILQEPAEPKDTY